MQYEHQHYAEVRSIKKLGHMHENDEAEIMRENEREAREKLRRQLKQELSQIQKSKKRDPEREDYLEDELDRMRQQDEKKISLYRQLARD